MSETVMTTGVFWKLKKPLTNEEYSEIDEILYDLKSGLRINYEGTLLYSSKTDNDYYGIFFNVKGRLFTNPRNSRKVEGYS